MNEDKNIVFPTLPVIEDLISNSDIAGSSSFAGVMLVCVQHILESTGSLIEAVLRLGVSPSRVFILGKSYSTNSEVCNKLRKLVAYVHPGSLPTDEEYSSIIRDDISRLWAEALAECEKQKPRAILLLDDGGRAIKSIPAELEKEFPIIAIEQTTSGINRLSSYINLPIINVASSAAKKHYEANLIAKTIISKLRVKLGVCSLESLRVGIVGAGNIGTALLVVLNKLGVTPALHDSNQMPILGDYLFCPTLNKLMTESDIIFGCTGSDVFSNFDWEKYVQGELILVSCTTEDIEFRSVLSKNHSHHNGITPFATAIVETPNAKVSILAGGFPINFDQSPVSVPNDKIQMTRGLLLIGLFQAMQMIERFPACPRGIQKLSPEMQYSVLNSWLNTGKKTEDGDYLIIPSVEWLRRNSCGQNTCS